MSETNTIFLNEFKKLVVNYFNNFNNTVDTEISVLGPYLGHYFYIDLNERSKSFLQFITQYPSLIFASTGDLLTEMKKNVITQKLLDTNFNTIDLLSKTITELAKKTSDEEDIVKLNAYKMFMKDLIKMDYPLNTYEEFSNWVFKIDNPYIKLIGNSKEDIEEIE